MAIPKPAFEIMFVFIVWKKKLQQKQMPPKFDAKTSVEEIVKKKKIIFHKVM